MLKRFIYGHFSNAYGANVIQKLHNKQKSPDLSIVIPSYNQEKTVAKAIESVINQKTDLKYEIIVVDSSDNKTYQILKKYFPKIRLIHLNKRAFCGKAKNIGIRTAKADIVAFTDTDCIVDERWVDNMYEAHKKYDIVGPRIGNGNPDKILGWSLFLLEFGEFTDTKSKIKENVVGCSSYKKSIFKKYGYFLELPSGEDFFFHSKIKEKKFYSSNVVINHINRTDILTIIMHSFKLGTWDAYAIKLNSDMKGAFVLKYKFLIPFLVFYRFFLISGRAIRSNNSLIFFLISPLIFADLIAWNLGFLNGSFIKNKDSLW